VNYVVISLLSDLCDSDILLCVTQYLQGTVNLPAGLNIPPGSILMKNDQGQLMLVPGGSQVNSPVRPVLQV